jgi:hypothetical protein
MDRNQAGRRNCPPEDFKILCGWIYNRKKKTQNDGGRGTPKATVGQVGPRFVEPTDATAEQVAAELDVSPRTVKRNGQRAEVYDAMLSPSVGCKAEATSGFLGASSESSQLL